MLACFFYFLFFVWAIETSHDHIKNPNLSEVLYIIVKKTILFTHYYQWKAIFSKINVNFLENKRLFCFSTQGHAILLSTICARSKCFAWKSIKGFYQNHFLTMVIIFSSTLFFARKQSKNFQIRTTATATTVCLCVLYFNYFWILGAQTSFFSFCCVVHKNYFKQIYYAYDFTE